MKLLLWLLLASLCPLWTRGFPPVLQTPDVFVTEGNTLTISCCWTTEARRLKVTWLKNGTSLKNETIKPDGSSKGHSCLNLTLTHISQEDSGRYMCRVQTEVPEYSVMEGNGTTITVVAQGRGEGPGGVEVSYHLLTFLVVSLLLLLVFTTLCLQRYRRAVAARVIYEIPHTDSEVADVDKRSTGSSAGSSQWCQVPVYESFDYFEGLQMGGTK